MLWKAAKKLAIVSGHRPAVRRPLVLAVGGARPRAGWIPWPSPPSRTKLN